MILENLKQQAENIKGFKIKKYDIKSQDILEFTIPLDEKNYFLFLIIERAECSLHSWMVIDGRELSLGDICLNEDFNLLDYINILKKEMNLCPHCKKEVGYKNFKSVGFTGRCCDECYPELKEKIEFPGWCS